MWQDSNTICVGAGNGGCRALSAGELDLRWYGIQRVVLMLETVLVDFDDTKTRRVFAQRATNGSAGDHLHVTRFTVGVAVIMTGEDGTYVVLFHGHQSCLSSRYG